ncbi:hypothetical protein BC830DRAFT_1174665 [Chytriomyces sp. MP71]|nr:hypothetical protein BC830DRAFT_1174665 [Chytriomyces sp. MP71]
MSSPDSVVNVISSAILSASSTDGMSLECLGGKCDAQNVANGASGRFELQWQSAADTACKNQWIQATWPKKYDIQGFMIGYGSLGTIFDVDNKYFQVILNPASIDPRDVSLTTQCNNTIYNGAVTRIDNCRLLEGIEGGIYGIRFTWGLSRSVNLTGWCQMNVMEIIIPGTLSVDPPQSPPVNTGGIVGIVISSLVLATCLALFCIRQYNLRKRRRTGRLLLDANRNPLLGTSF